MKKKRFFLLFTLLIASASLKAEEPNAQKMQIPLCEYCEYDNTCCLQKGSSWGTFTVDGEFLYWQPIITGLAYVITHSDIQLPFGTPFGPGTYPNNLSIRNAGFDYGPGYRVAARYTLPKTAWDLSADYTQFTKTGHDSVQAGNGLFIITLWDAPGAINPTHASTELQVKLKQINATIGKTIWATGCFTTRPKFGAQFYKLDCNEGIQYVGTTTVNNVDLNSTSNVQLITDTKGWGLLVGVDAIWRLPCHFELFGQTAYGVLRTLFVSHQNQQIMVDTQPEIDLTSLSRFKGIIQSVEMKGGINWNCEFNCDHHPLAIKLYVAYEMNVWLQDVQLTRAIPIGTPLADAVTINIGNVGFHGLTTGAAFSF